MDVGRIKEGVQGIFFVFPYCAVTKAVSMEGDVNREDRGGSYGGSHIGFHAMRRRSRVIRDMYVSEDPQPVFDRVEEGEGDSEGEGTLGKREDIVEMEDALRDMFQWLWFG